jgi:hypothetical protein
MRLFGLLAAAACGGIGTICLLNCSGGSVESLSSSALQWTAPFANAELGIGPIEEASPFLVDDSQDSWEAATPRASNGGIWPSAIETPEIIESPTRDRGVPARLISNPAPAGRNGIGSRTPSGWIVVANSAEGRPLHLRTIGTGSAKTLVVAGLDGEDRIAVNWVDQFVQQLGQSPDQLRDYQLVFLRAANPDGLTARHLENSRGVALNRNFPTANFRPGGNPSAGAGPASETETRAVMQAIYDLRPQRVVHLVSASTSSEAICNGVADEAANSLADTVGLTVENFDPRKQAGSLEEFATTVLGIEVVTLRLRIGEDWRSAAVTHYPTFLAGSVPRVHRGSLAQTTRNNPRHTIDENDDPVSATSAAPVTRRRNSGYEELPPPPNKRGF